MKKICTLAIIAAICIGLTGCGGGKDSAQPEESTASEGAAGELTAGTTPPQLVNHTPTDETQSTATDADGNLLPYGYSTEQILARADNSKPAEVMITKTYSIKEVFDRFGYYMSAKMHSGYFISPEMYNASFEIECLRDMGNENYYAVTKIEEGGYLYAFFPKDCHHDLDAFFYVNKPLDKNTFSKIQKGQTMADVAKLDPVVTYWKEKGVVYNCTQTGGIFYTFHLFKDCIWMISYMIDDLEQPTPEGLVVKDIRKYPDRILVLDMEYEENGEIKKVYEYGSYDFSILPQDYPR